MLDMEFTLSQGWCHKISTTDAWTQQLDSAWCLEAIDRDVSEFPWKLSLFKEDHIMKSYPSQSLVVLIQFGTAA